MNEKLLDIYILQFYFRYNQHIWYIYILRVMRCWVTLTMTCIILFCLPCYSIPRSNCSFKKLLILTPEWNVGTSGAESNIFFHCIRFKITFLSEMNSNIIPFTEQWFATLLYVFFNNKIIKMHKDKNSANIDRPRIKVFIESFDRCFGNDA